MAIDLRHLRYVIAVATIPLIDVPAPDIELVYQPSRATRATRMLVDLARDGAGG